MLRDLTGGRSEVQVSGRTLREVVRSLDQQYPGMAARLLEDGRPRSEIAFAVDGVVADLGLLQPVEERSEVIIMPAISGG